MRALIDTNILLDYLIGREPYYEFADQEIAYCAAKKLNGFMAAHSIPNLFYFLRKDMTEEDRRNVLLRLCKILKVEGIDQHKILCALNKKEFSDFEDCLQTECAIAIQADYIITRNVKDFSQSRIPAITAEEFCTTYQKILDN